MLQPCRKPDTKHDGGVVSHVGRLHDLQVGRQLHALGDGGAVVDFDPIDVLQRQHGAEQVLEIVADPCVKIAYAERIVGARGIESGGLDANVRRPADGTGRLVGDSPLAE